MESPAATLGVIDYLVFGGVLLVSVLIGIYHSWSSGKQPTTKEYLLANKGMSALPVAFSLMASFMSAITLLGVSAENYVYGTQFIMINVSYIIGTPVCAFVFLPVFYQMQSSSAYEYLEQRFGKLTRICASVCFVLQMSLYMAVVLYAPALAISAVAGLSKWTAIVTVGTVCTIYSALGGIKAVLWTDVFQSFVMFVSMSLVIVKGTTDVGGLSNVWRIANEGGRINFFNFDPDPTVRHTVWTLAIGGVFVYVSIYGVNQTQVQRLMTVKNLKSSQLSLFLSWPIVTLLSLVTSLTGLVVYANFHGCDPLLRPKETNVQSPDQLLPYFVMQSLSQIPGIPGFFIAGIFSGALSTVSSAINSLAAVTLEDYVRPFCLQADLPEQTVTRISKMLAFFYGVLCVALTYLAEQLGGILQASLTIFGVMGGPLLGLFSLGMLFPHGNQKGAIIGLLTSLSLCLWIGFGANLSQAQTPRLSLSVEQCLQNNLMDNITMKSVNNNYSEIILASSNKLEMKSNISNTLYDGETENSVHTTYVFPLYRLSYMWYAGFGWCLSLFIGIIVSFLTGGNKTYNSKLYAPFILKSKYRRNMSDSPTTDSAEFSTYHFRKV